MAQEEEAIPPVARPRQEEVEFDLDAALAAVVAVRAEVPEDAFTARTLGTERRGSGVVIDRSGLVLTIGYLVTEAEQVWLMTGRQQAAAAHVLAYDQASGFGLVQPLARLETPHLPLASAVGLAPGAPVVVAGAGGSSEALSARLIAKRTFAGYWEYVLDEALFTAPAHPNWGGAACISAQGGLVGIGSLLVRDAGEGGEAMIGNMVVPTDALLPVLDDLLRFGQPNRPPRPWLGLFATDAEEGIVVTGLAPRGPAAHAGLAEGDIVVEIGGHRITDLADLWRRLWSHGEAGVVVTLGLLRHGRLHELSIATSDRQRFLKRPNLH